MTTDIQSKIDRIKSGLLIAEGKLVKYENMARDADGKLSESFHKKIQDAREQKEKLSEKLIALEKEQIQSWENVNIGTTMVSATQNLLNEVEKLLKKLTGHDDAD